jgi:hypothetical protein
MSPVRSHREPKSSLPAHLIMAANINQDDFMFPKDELQRDSAADTDGNGMKFA